MMNVPKRRDSPDVTDYFAACKADLKRNLAGGLFPAYLAESVAHLESPRLLDVGCGIGQALFLVAANCGGSGVGLDVSAQAMRWGREFRTNYLPHTQVSFVQAGAESLPFPGATFDMVLCRLALPYMDNKKTIAEIARVLKPGGVFVLRIHHLHYYLRQFRYALFPLQLPLLIYALRVLIAGVVYHLTGRQLRIRALSETFQTRWRLAKELAGSDLTIVRELSDSTSEAPDFFIRKLGPPNRA